MMIDTHSPTRAACAALLACGMATAAPAAAAPDPVVATEIIGTAFRIGLASGRVLQGAELAGATLSLLMPGEAGPRRLRLDAIQADPRDPAGEVLLHRVSLLDAAGVASELCEPDPEGDRWMFPLRGQWDAEGQRVSETGFTLTCSAGAQGKCVRFGYKPWKTLPDGTALADYHASCVRMVRADYCGGQGTTRNGMLIDLYDRLGIQRPDDGTAPADLRFEAAWGPTGALCVAHTRVPQNISLDGLARSCPRLRDRLGPAACDAASAATGPALLFNRSR